MTINADRRSQPAKAIVQPLPLANASRDVAAPSAERQHHQEAAGRPAY
jgi:hypothetical protein